MSQHDIWSYYSQLICRQVRWVIQAPYGVHIYGSIDWLDTCNYIFLVFFFFFLLFFSVSSCSLVWCFSSGDVYIYAGRFQMSGEWSIYRFTLFVRLYFTPDSFSQPLNQSPSLFSCGMVLMVIEKCLISVFIIWPFFSLFSLFLYWVSSCFLYLFDEIISLL